VIQLCTETKLFDPTFTFLALNHQQPLIQLLSTTHPCQQLHLQHIQKLFTTTASIQQVSSSTIITCAGHLAIAWSITSKYTPKTQNSKLNAQHTFKEKTHNYIK
jgi:hypothetical protein